jgi:hypothetical protein
VGGEGRVSSPAGGGYRVLRKVVVDRFCAHIVLYRGEE